MSHRGLHTDSTARTVKNSVRMSPSKCPLFLTECRPCEVLAGNMGSTSKHLLKAHIAILGQARPDWSSTIHACLRDSCLWGLRLFAELP